MKKNYSFNSTFSHGQQVFCIINKKIKSCRIDGFSFEKYGGMKPTIQYRLIYKENNVGVPFTAMESDVYSSREELIKNL